MRGKKLKFTKGSSYRIISKVRKKVRQQNKEVLNKVSQNRNKILFHGLQ